MSQVSDSPKSAADKTIASSDNIDRGKTAALVLLGILIGGLAEFVLGIYMYLNVCWLDCSGTVADQANIYFYGCPVAGAILGGLSFSQITNLKN